MPKLLSPCGRIGNRYYTLWGDFLGMHGYENNIKVYTNNTMLNAAFLLGSQRKPLDEKDIIEKSVRFDKVSEHARLIIIQKIAYSIGLFNVLTTYIPSKEVSKQRTKEDSGYVNHNTGKIMINPNSRFHINGDYYNILLTLHHEKYHYEHHYKKGYFKSQENKIEYETYKYIYNHPLFYETTFDYQGMVVKEMQKNAHKIDMQPEY